MREFESGATRDSEDGKFDYEGFLSPLVLTRFAEYMHEHRKQADGKLRPSDNWQRGMPLDSYVKSAWRHFMDWWQGHRASWADEEALCALLFNVQGYLHEVLKSKTAVAQPVQHVPLVQHEPMPLVGTVSVPQDNVFVTRGRVECNKCHEWHNADAQHFCFVVHDFVPPRVGGCVSGPG